MTQSQISETILDEFIEFKGDMRAFVRAGRGPLEFDWDSIDDILQQIFLIRAGLASAAFRARLEAELQALSSSERVQQRLWEIAGDRVKAAHGKVVY